MRLRIIWVGKTKSAPLALLIQDYLERINNLVPCSISEMRDAARGKGSRGADAVRLEANALCKAMDRGTCQVVLDEGGRQFSSIEFSGWLREVQNTGAREITFVIGGPDGVAEEVRRRAGLVLSLGRMTWTHEICRALLLEQIYRSLCIMRNIPYHR